MSNVQSVISAVPAAVKAKANGKAKVKTSTADINGMTRESAIRVVYEYGRSMAGLDGSLTAAITAFLKDDEVMSEMFKALEVGYYERKLLVDKTEATRIAGLLKFNENKQDDKHRTFEQERIAISVRVLWSRAKKMAGVPKSEQAAKGEATRAAKEADRKVAESRLIAADAIVNPKDDTDPFDALARLVLTMKSLQKKYADKLVGDRGAEWRDWLASAPK